MIAAARESDDRYNQHRCDPSCRYATDELERPRGLKPAARTGFEAVPRRWRSFALRVCPKSPSLTVGVRKEPGCPSVLGRTLSWVVVAFAAATTGCASRDAATIVVSTESWNTAGANGRQFTTEHFHIYSTVTDTRFESALPGFLEAIYSEYERVMPHRQESARPLTMYVFGDRGQWDRFIRRHHADNYPVYSRIRAGGFTERDTSVLFYTDRSRTLATIAHEGLHAYIGGRFGESIPAWLNEGLACYFEDAERLRGGDVRITPRRNTIRINALRRALQRGEALPLATVVATDPGEVITRTHSARTHLYYAQVWALVTFLMHDAGSDYARGFSEMLHDVATGAFSTRVSAARVIAANPSNVSGGAAAMHAYFGHGPEDLAQRYASYLVRLCGY